MVVVLTKNILLPTSISSNYCPIRNTRKHWTESKLQQKPLSRLPYVTITAVFQLIFHKGFDAVHGYCATSVTSDIDSIVTTILRISEMVTNHPEIAEMDINPLIVHARDEGCSVADSRVMLRVG